MPTFEVYIPAKTGADMNVTLTVDAPNWLGALRTGLVNLGEDPQVVTNIMCDIQSDNSIHVTDLVSGRVFRLIETGAAAAPADAATTQPALTAQPVPAPVATQPVPARPAPAPLPLEVSAAEVVEEVTLRDVPSPLPVAPAAPPVAPSVQQPAPADTPPAPAPARRERFRPAPEPRSRSVTRPTPSDPKIGRQEPRVDLEEAVAEIFERTQELYGEHLNPDRIVNELLDLAMEKIPSGAGTFYVADISGHDLQFAAVRGPKAQEILSSGLRVPMGQGIAGFCALEGVSLSIGDVQRDPRFAREISEKIGYDAHSMLCVPLEKEGRCYGAIQLINRVGATTYSQTELSLLAAVAREGVELLSQVQT